MLLLWSYYESWHWFLFMFLAFKLELFTLWGLGNLEWTLVVTHFYLLFMIALIIDHTSFSQFVLYASNCNRFFLLFIHEVTCFQGRQNFFVFIFLIILCMFMIGSFWNLRQFNSLWIIDKVKWAAQKLWAKCTSAFLDHRCLILWKAFYLLHALGLQVLWLTY